VSADPLPLSAVLDVASYCDRIGYSGALAPTAATLRALHQAHVGAIPFENIDVLLGRPIPLDTASLHRKLIESRRGGYCFEQNLLFKDVLESLGYSVIGLAARVRAGAAAGIRPRTHMVLLVEAERQTFLCDVGFGGTGLLEPLPFIAGHEVELPIFSFRVVERDGSWVLQARQQGDWDDLYAFTLEPQERIDYEVANHFTSTFPSSIFRSSLTAQRTRREERVILRNRDLTILRMGSEQKRQINSSAEARAVLAELIGLELPRDYVLPETIFADTR
jgi:N-hydroxyarylamine O-acetyltransferase